MLSSVLCWQWLLCILALWEIDTWRWLVRIAHNFAGFHWALLLVQFLVWNFVLNIETYTLKRSKNSSFSFLSKKLLLTFFPNYFLFAENVFTVSEVGSMAVRIPNRRETPNFISMEVADSCFWLCIASFWLVLHHHSLLWGCLLHSVTGNFSLAVKDHLQIKWKCKGIVTKPHLNICSGTGALSLKSSWWHWSLRYTQSEPFHSGTKSYYLG